MSPNAKSAAPAGAGTAAWYARRLTAGWSGVDVDFVEVVPQPGGGRVRAVVRLGVLAPADVQVELRPADLDDARGAGSPMWSAQSYDNGCYVFESPMASDQGATDGEWIVRVRPRAPLPTPDVQRRLRLGTPGPTPSREVSWSP